MDSFRKFSDNTSQQSLYLNMYKNQSVDFVKSKIKEYSITKKCCMSISEALALMDDFVDSSDPDINLPNSIHAYQTAESIKKKYPNNEEMQVCGLIHDTGKILYKFNEPEWAVVGDTFVVGCKYPETMVYNDLIVHSPDRKNPIYNTKYGIYRKNCGIENLLLSFGHDQYLYNVLQNNNHNLSKKYQDIIRFHSFYPWHTHKEYTHFMKPSDYNILDNVLEFNSFDLYSKRDKFILTDEIKEYYSKLLDKYFPNKLMW